jgi:hypothetical protein
MDTELKSPRIPKIYILQIANIVFQKIQAMGKTMKKGGKKTDGEWSVVNGQ